MLSYILIIIENRGILMIQPFKNNNVKTCFGTAVQKALPIMCSYFFVSMAYGMMMNADGYPWVDSLLVSMTVYTGAFQFVLTTLLSSGASLLTIAATAFLMNSRQIFYSMTMRKRITEICPIGCINWEFFCLPPLWQCLSCIVFAGQSQIQCHGSRQ